MPSSFSKEYKNAIGQDPNGCYARLWSEVGRQNEDIDPERRAVAAKSVCDEIECQLRKQCTPYIKMCSEQEEQDSLTDEEKATIQQMRTWAQTAQRGGLDG